MRFVTRLAPFSFNFFFPGFFFSTCGCWMGALCVAVVLLLSSFFPRESGVARTFADRSLGRDVAKWDRQSGAAAA